MSHAIANIQKMEIELRRELKTLTGIELMSKPVEEPTKLPVSSTRAIEAPLRNRKSGILSSKKLLIELFMIVLDVIIVLGHSWHRS